MNEFLYNQITDILEENNIHINEFIQYAKQKQNKQTKQKAKEKYQEGKAQAIEDAIAWQLEAGERCLSYSELAEIGAHFEKLAKKYGLIKEFKENGII